MSSLIQLFSADRIVCDGEESSRKRALQRLASLLSPQHEVEIFDGLLARERLGSTAIGHGIALPHTRCACAQGEKAALLILRNGVDCEADDRQPCDLFVALSVPDDDPEQHLQTLATLAETLRHPGFADELRACQNPAAVFALLDHYSQPTSVAQHA